MITLKAFVYALQAAWSVGFAVFSFYRLNGHNPALETFAVEWKFEATNT